MLKLTWYVRFSGPVIHQSFKPVLIQSSDLTLMKHNPEQINKGLQDYNKNAGRCV